MVYGRALIGAYPEHYGIITLYMYVLYLISISVEGDRVIKTFTTSLKSALKVVVKAFEIKRSVIELRGGKMTPFEHLFTRGQ